MKSNIKTILEWIIVVVFAVAFTLVFRTYVAEGRFVPTDSMHPTLQEGDRLIIEKVTFKMSGIQRGDIVVFTPPERSDKKEDMVKRVIGLPGETLSIKSGTVYINGSALNEPYQPEKPRADFGPYKVPEGSYFVMGDNRNKSYDSRYWGPVYLSSVIGKTMVLYYPFDRIHYFKRHYSA